MSRCLLDLKPSIESNMKYCTKNSLGFERNDRQLIQAFTLKRLQKVLVYNTESEWIEFYQGISQGTVPGPLLFNTYFSYLSTHINNQCNIQNADVTLVYACNKNLDIAKKP